MSYTFNFAQVWRAMPDLLFGLGLALVSLAIAMIIGLALAFGMTSRRRVVSAICRAYVTLFRNIPLILIVYFAFLGLPQLGIRLDKYTAFGGSLMLYGAAYMAEIFRGGLLTIPKGVVDAGRAIGLVPLQIKVWIILPILIQKTRPLLGNAYISLFKDTSIASVIGVPELTFYARKLNLETFRIFETWLVTSALYIATVFLIANALRYLDWKTMREGR